MFKGHEEVLKKVVFQCDRPAYASQFKKTLKELAHFVEKEHKGGQDIGYIFHEMKDTKLTEPTKLPTTADEYYRAIWPENYEEYREKKCKLEELKSMTYALVLGQSLPGVMTKLEG